MYSLFLVHNIIFSLFSGITTFSIKTTASTQFIFNPATSRTEEIAKWRDANSSSIQALKDPSAILSKHPSKNACTDFMLDLLSENPQVPDRDRWVKVTIRAYPESQRLFYISCSKCTKAAGYKLGEIFTCIKCENTECKAVPWGRLNAILDDESSQLEVTMFDPMAEVILKKSPKELATMTPEVAITKVFPFAK